VRLLAAVGHQLAQQARLLLHLRAVLVLQVPVYRDLLIGRDLFRINMYVASLELASTYMIFLFCISHSSVRTTWYNVKYL
jgi:hypothetical protein